MRLFKVRINQQVYEVEVEEIGGSTPVLREIRTQGPVPAAVPAVHRPVAEVPGEAQPAPVATPATAAPVFVAPAATQGAVPQGGGSGETILSPMPGKIQSVAVKEGDTVQAGDLMVILEAMKMDNEIFSSAGGLVTEVRVSPGATVNPGDVLVVIS